MQNKTKVITIATIISSVITTVLILIYFMGIGFSLELGILFLAITEMLIGINQYELAKRLDKSGYNITGDLCIFVGIIIFVVIIIQRVV